MKTLLAILISEMINFTPTSMEGKEINNYPINQGKILDYENILISSIPQVVTSKLIGFNIYPNGVISLAWDLEKNDNKEDVRVFYRFELGLEVAYTFKPYVYFQDLNGNLKYEDNEEFRMNNKK